MVSDIHLRGALLVVSLAFALALSDEPTSLELHFHPNGTRVPNVSCGTLEKPCGSFAAANLEELFNGTDFYSNVSLIFGPGIYNVDLEFGYLFLIAINPSATIFLGSTDPSGERAIFRCVRGPQGFEFSSAFIFFGNRNESTFIFNIGIEDCYTTESLLLIPQGDSSRANFSYVEIVNLCADSLLWFSFTLSLTLCLALIHNDLRCNCTDADEFDSRIKSLVYIQSEVHLKYSTFINNSLVSSLQNNTSTFCKFSPFIMRYYGSSELLSVTFSENLVYMDSELLGTTGIVYLLRDRSADLTTHQPITVKDSEFVGNAVYAVRRAFGAALTVVGSELDEVIIQNSTFSFNKLYVEDGFGTALSVAGNAVIIDSSVFSSNRLQSKPTSSITTNYFLGGAVNIENSPSAVISDTLFYNNIVNSTDDSTLTVTGSGALNVFRVINLTVINSTFDLNRVHLGCGKNFDFSPVKGGAVFQSAVGTATYLDSHFTNNLAESCRRSYGGAIAVQTSNNGQESRNIKDVRRSDVRVWNCNFKNNTALQSSAEWYAGSLAAGGAVSCDDLSTDIFFDIFNTTFANNSAVTANSASSSSSASSCAGSGSAENVLPLTLGGALFGKYIVLANSTFLNNSVRGEYGQGGAVLMSVPQESGKLPFSSISGCLFDQNFVKSFLEGDFSGGGSVFLKKSRKDGVPHCAGESVINVYDVVFNNSRAKRGASIFAQQYNQDPSCMDLYLVKNVSFMGNISESATHYYFDVNFGGKHPDFNKTTKNCFQEGPAEFDTNKTCSTNPIVAEPGSPKTILWPGRTLRGIIFRLYDAFGAVSKNVVSPPFINYETVPAKYSNLIQTWHPEPVVEERNASIILVSYLEIDVFGEENGTFPTATVRLHLAVSAAAATMDIFVVSCPPGWKRTDKDMRDYPYQNPDYSKTWITCDACKSNEYNFDGGRECHPCPTSDHAKADHTETTDNSRMSSCFAFEEQPGDTYAFIVAQGYFVESSDELAPSSPHKRATLAHLGSSFQLHPCPYEGACQQRECKLHHSDFTDYKWNLTKIMSNCGDQCVKGREGYLCSKCSCDEKLVNGVPDFEDCHFPLSTMCVSCRHALNNPVSVFLPFVGKVVLVLLMVGYIASSSKSAHFLEVTVILILYLFGLVRLATVVIVSLFYFTQSAKKHDYNDAHRPFITSAGAMKIMIFFLETTMLVNEEFWDSFLHAILSTNLSQASIKDPLVSALFGIKCFFLSSPYPWIRDLASSTVFDKLVPLVAPFIIVGLIAVIKFSSHFYNLHCNPNPSSQSGSRTTDTDTDPLIPVLIPHKSVRFLCVADGRLFYELFEIALFVFYTCCFELTEKTVSLAALHADKLTCEHGHMKEALWIACKHGDYDFDSLKRIGEVFSAFMLFIYAILLYLSFHKSRSWRAPSLAHSSSEESLDWTEFISENYVSKFAFFEIGWHMRNIAVIVTIHFLSWSRPLLTVCVVFFVLSWDFSILYYKPYLSPRESLLESLCSFVVLATFLCQEHQSFEPEDRLRFGIAITLFILHIIAMAILFSVLLYARLGRRKRKKAPRAEDNRVYMDDETDVIFEDDSNMADQANSELETLPEDPPLTPRLQLNPLVNENHDDL